METVPKTRHRIASLTHYETLLVTGKKSFFLSRVLTEFMTAETPFCNHCGRLHRSAVKDVCEAERVNVGLTFVCNRPDLFF